MNWAFTAHSLIPSWHNICPNCNLSGLWDVIHLVPTVCILWYILFSSWDIGQCVLVAVYWKLDWFVFVKSIAYRTLFFICCKVRCCILLGCLLKVQVVCLHEKNHIWSTFFICWKPWTLSSTICILFKYPVVFMSMHQTVQFDWDFVLSDLLT